MGALPEVERRDILVGIMPYNPTTMDVIRDFRQNQREDFTEPIDEHGAIGLQDTQTLLDPLFAPNQIVIHRLLVTVISKVLSNIVRRICDNDLSGVVL